MSRSRFKSTHPVNEFLDQLSNTFKIDKMSSNSFYNEKYCCFIYLKTPGTRIKLEIPQNIGNIAETLDTRIVEEYILETNFGNQSIRTDDRIDFVGGSISIEKIVVG